MLDKIYKSVPVSQSCIEINNHTSISIRPEHFKMVDLSERQAPVFLKRNDPKIDSHQSLDSEDSRKKRTKRKRSVIRNSEEKEKQDGLFEGVI